MAAKSIRGEFYRRRWLMAAESLNVIFSEDPQAALTEVLARADKRIRLLVLPDGRSTLPKVTLHKATE